MHTQRDRLGGRERAEKKGRLAGVEAVGGGGAGSSSQEPLSHRGPPLSAFNSNLKASEDDLREEH